MFNHVLDTALKLTNHEEDKVDEKNLPNDGNIEERNKSQKEGDEEIARKQVPDKRKEVIVSYMKGGVKGEERFIEGSLMN